MKKRFLPALLALAILLGMFPLAALATDVEVGTGTGAISGTVYAFGDTSNPIASATVKLYTDAACTDENAVPGAEATTDSDGKYSFTKVNDGTYYIKATKEGYADKSEQVTSNGSNTDLFLQKKTDIPTFTSAATVTMQFGYETTLDLTLGTAGSDNIGYYVYESADATTKSSNVSARLDDTEKTKLTLTFTQPPAKEYTLYITAKEGEDKAESDRSAAITVKPFTPAKPVFVSNSVTVGSGEYAHMRVDLTLTEAVVENSASQFNVYTKKDGDPSAFEKVDDPSAVLASEAALGNKTVSLSFTSAPTEAVTLYFSLVGHNGVEGPMSDAVTVNPSATTEKTATPAFSASTVKMADDTAKTVDLTLTADGSANDYKVYDSESATSVSSTVSAALDGTDKTKLTLTFTQAPTQDVTVYITATAKDGSKLESEKAAVTVQAYKAYTINKPTSVVGGTFTVTVDSAPATKAEAGKTVTVATTPGTGLTPTVTVKDADNGTVAVSESNNTFTFTMPAKDVTVDVSFTNKSLAVTPGSTTVMGLKQVNVTGMQTSYFYVIRIANGSSATTQDANSVILTAKQVSAYSFNCKPGQLVQVYEFAQESDLNVPSGGGTYEVEALSFKQLDAV